MEERFIGTVSRGVRAPIIRQGDDIAAIVAESVLDAAKSENIEIRDKDVVAVTEAVVARAQGNYASVDQIATDISAKFPEGTFGVIFRFCRVTVSQYVLRALHAVQKRSYLCFLTPRMRLVTIL